jgi:hypothetical protein
MPVLSAAKPLEELWDTVNASTGIGDVACETSGTAGCVAAAATNARRITEFVLETVLRGGSWEEVAGVALLRRRRDTRSETQNDAKTGR